MKKIAIYLIVYLFLLYDNYLSPPGVRVFDVVGWLIMYVSLFMGLLEVKFKYNSRVSLSFFIIVPILCVGMILGVINGSASVIPFVFGMISFIILSRSETLKRNLYGIVKSLLVLLALGMIIQFIVFQLAGEMQSLLLFRDEALRIGGGLLHRPTGFYIEPGQNTSAMILLLTLYGTMKAKLDWVTYLSALSVIVSMSFAGIGGIILYFFFVGLKGSKNKAIYYLLFILMICLVLFLLSLFDASKLFILDRMDTINAGKDGSFHDRLALLSEYSCHQWMVGHSFLFPIFGGGISSDAYSGNCGANNISWSLFSFGYIGSLVILLNMLIKYWQYPLFIMGLIYIGVANLNASFAFFWFWLAAIVLIISVNNDKHKIAAEHIN